MSTFARKNEGMLIGVIVIACFLALYNTSSMNVALPEFMRHFDASVMVVQWVSIGYTVVMGVASPLSSWFVRRFTLRNYFIYSMWGYALLSFLSGCVDNIYFMIVIRAVQGVCGNTGYHDCCFSFYSAQPTAAFFDHTKYEHLSWACSWPGLGRPVADACRLALDLLEQCAAFHHRCDPCDEMPA